MKEEKNSCRQDIRMENGENPHNKFSMFYVSNHSLSSVQDLRVLSAFVEKKKT